MLKNTHYNWTACLNTEDFDAVELFDNFKNKEAFIAGILSGEVHFEKMNNYPIYKTRINKDTRLLGTTLQKDGHSYFVLLVLIVNHDYHKTRFLQPGVLPHYLNKNMQRLMEEISSRSQESISTWEEEEAVISVAYDPHTRYYNGDFIQLNTDQQEILQTERMPLLLVGAPGTGKTFVLKELMRVSHQLTLAEEDAKPVLFITKSPALVESVKRLLDDQGVLPATLEVLSYDELVIKLDPSCVTTHEEIDGELSSLTKVDESSFYAWFRKQIKSYRSEYELKEQHVLQELRLLSIYTLDTSVLNKTNYEEDLGQRQSLFTKELRPLIWQIYMDYQQHLQDVKQWDPSFHTLTAREMFSAVFVDEAMDFSLKQLMQLFYLSSNNRYVMALDQRQSLYDEKSHRALLLHLFKIVNDIDLNCVTLQKSYRCKHNILKLANLFLEIKSEIIGGTVDKGGTEILPLSETSDDNPGRVHFINQEKIDRLKPLLASTDYAIVTHPEHFALVNQLLDYPPLLFNIKQIKGLEFENVIFINPYADQLHHGKNINKIVAAWLGKDHAASASTNRSKKIHEDSSVILWFNALLTAITRTKGDLYLCDLNTSEHRNIHSYITKHYKPTYHIDAAQELTVSTSEEWLDQIITLLQKGDLYTEQARKAFVTYVDPTPNAFDLFYQQIKSPTIALKSAAINDSSLTRASTNKLRKKTKSSKKKSSSHEAINSQDVLPIVTPMEARYTPTLSIINELEKDIKKNQLSTFSPDKIMLQLLEPIPGDEDQSYLDIILNTPKYITNFCKWLALPEGSIVLEKLSSQRFVYECNIMHIAAFHNCTKIINFFAKQLLDLNLPNKYGQTPLYHALLNGNVAAVRAFIHCGVNPEEILLPKSKLKKFPLYIPINYGTAEIISNFMSESISIGEYYDWKRFPSIQIATPFFLAVESGNLAEVYDLLEQNPNLIHEYYGEESLTPLIVAIQRANYTLTEDLIHHGANVDGSNNQFIPLIIAAQFGYEDIVSLLLSKGAWIDRRSEQGCTALITATYFKHINIVKLLLEHGAGIEKLMFLNHEKVNAILIARKYQSEEDYRKILSLLLAKESQLNHMKQFIKELQSSHDRHFIIDKLHSLFSNPENSINLMLLSIESTALDDNISLFEHLLIHRKYSFITFFENQLDMPKEQQLLYIISLQLKFHMGQSILHILAKNNCCTLFNIIKDYGIDMFPLDFKGRTPLVIAQICHAWDIALQIISLDAYKLTYRPTSESFPFISTIVRAYALTHIPTIKKVILSLMKLDSEKTYRNGPYRPLLIAIECNVLELIVLFIGAKSNLDEPDSAMMTPLMHAAFLGNISILTALLSHEVNLFAINELTQMTALDYAKIQKHHDAEKLIREAICQCTGQAELCMESADASAQDAAPTSKSIQSLGLFARKKPSKSTIEKMSVFDDLHTIL